MLLLWAIDTCWNTPSEKKMCNCRLPHSYPRYGVKSGNGGKDGGGIKQALGNPRAQSTTQLQAAFSQLCTIRYVGGDTRTKWSQDRILMLLPQLVSLPDPLLARHSYDFTVKMKVASTDLR